MKPTTPAPVSLPLLLLVLFPAPSLTWAQIVPEPVQGTTVLQQAPESCPDCTITMTRELVLHSGGEDLGGVWRGPLYRDSRGRFFHLNGIVSSAVLVFDSRGRYVRGIEQSGRGPGEFVSIDRIVVGRGDTLHLFDQATGRLTTLTPELEFVRTSLVGINQWDAIEIRPGLIMANAYVRTPDRFGYPLHPIREGVLMPPMGGTEALADSDRPGGWVMNRYLVRESDSTFWAVHVPEYRFDLWRTDDTLLRVLTGDPGWFDVADRSTLKGRLNPTFMDLTRDDEGLLWALVRVRAEDWREHAVEGPLAAPGLPQIESNTGDYYDLKDSIIQVIDPASGVVVATERFDYPFLSFAGPRRLYTYQETRAGQPSVVVWKLALSSGAPEL